MKRELDLKSGNGGVLKDATVLVSTVSMPEIVGMDLGYRYETCVFAGQGSEVVARYNTMDEAVRGHTEQCKLHGVKP